MPKSSSQTAFSLSLVSFQINQHRLTFKWKYFTKFLGTNLPNFANKDFLNSQSNLGFFVNFLLNENECFYETSFEKIVVKATNAYFFVLIKLKQDIC